MAGLVPAIHVFWSSQRKQDVDARVKPRQDECRSPRRVSKDEKATVASWFETAHRTAQVRCRERASSP